LLTTFNASQLISMCVVSYQRQR